MRGASARDTLSISATEACPLVCSCLDSNPQGCVMAGTSVSAPWKMISRKMAHATAISDLPAGKATSHPMNYPRFIMGADIVHKIERLCSDDGRNDGKGRTVHEKQNGDDSGVYLPAAPLDTRSHGKRLTQHDFYLNNQHAASALNQKTKIIGQQFPTGFTLPEQGQENGRPLSRSMNAMSDPPAPAHHSSRVFPLGMYSTASLSTRSILFIL